MDALTTTPGADSNDDSPGEPRLVTVAEASKLCGVSRKAITGRLDRKTLRSISDPDGSDWRMIPVAELRRAGLLIDQSHPGESRGEVVQWQALYEQERHDRQDADAAAQLAAAAAAQLREELIALANAGPIRAIRLRRDARRRLAGEAPPAPAPDVLAESGA